MERLIESLVMLMSQILEINNWNQLVRAVSDYPNLRIKTTQYNSESLVGTKIQVVDYNTCDVYLTLFTSVEKSDVFPVDVSMELNDIVAAINRYGFHIRISEPQVIAPNVVTILQGLYESGYRYIYKDYHNHARNVDVGDQVIYGIYASKEIQTRRMDPDITKTPSFVPDEWKWCEPLVSYPIIDLLDGNADNGIPI